eukprot:TRINITY_DN1264_c0_g3_i2.p1 TRINITY_DN1264_c0_g3~~TRINITY_DN1264_c0_g3_i2.p1  ORF type:complete len:203 (+),score=40.44 TRINITY_DN1264_c0_g3_i2:182-790(+)
MNLTVDGGEEVAPGGNSSIWAAQGALHLESTRDRLSFIHVPSGMEFVTSSRKTIRKDAVNSYHLNIRFDKGVVTDSAAAAQGALPELWGTQPLSDNVSALILQRLHLKGSAEYGEDAYMKTQEHRANGLMGHFIRKLLAANNAKVGDDVAFQAFIPEYSGAHGLANFQSLLSALEVAPFVRRTANYVFVGSENDYENEIDRL